MKLDTVGAIVDAAGLAISNTAKDAEVAKLMGQYNFTPKRMQEGDNVLATVKALHNNKEAHYDGRWELANRIDKALETVRPVFREHVEVARFAFRSEPAILNSLNIKRIASNKWSWIKQADAFYQKLESHAEPMTRQGANWEEVAQAKASIAAIMEMRRDSMLIKGKAEDSTEMRNQAVKMLKNWVLEFRASARLALKDNPQKLEAFGIRVRSLQK
ncbi:hypothetical protein [Catalinimonas niigatensis]|uniref:hypothetical protein n=1 Tax=Catalinimonas niigatensis TaxID=1397264 RepID=UPI0026651190|nr:hypothetical protein [Catalinimonas niigatensis]WPP50391.1 hypothetical protein PZB72_27365 [Catalinimonas niigatensis]